MKNVSERAYGESQKGHQNPQGDVATVNIIDNLDTYSKVVPHSQEAGDPYDIGDVYDEAEQRAPQEWEIDMTGFPYLRYIKSISTAWPHLRYLANFMEVGTIPLKWKFLKNNETERQERAERTSVSILDYPTANTPLRQHISNAENLEEALKKRKFNKDESAVRLICIDDLSRRVIEIVGSAFDIDPPFFREQIDDYSWYNIRDQWVTLPKTRATMRQQKWIRLRFVRPRFFRSASAFQKARDQSTFFNVFRRLDDDANQWSLTDGDAIVGLTRTGISIWLDADDQSRGTLGVVMIDPTVEEGFPLWNGYRNWAPIPSMHDASRPPLCPPRVSLFEDVVYWMLRQPQVLGPNSGISSNSIVFLLHPIFDLICAEWLILCQYIKTRLSQIEWELGYPDEFEGDVIATSLKRLHTWRRRFPLYLEMLAETSKDVALLMSAAKDGTLSNTASHLGSSSTSSLTDILDELENINRRMTELQARTDQLTTVVVATISMEDARRGLGETRNVTRLTWISDDIYPSFFRCRSLQHAD